MEDFERLQITLNQYCPNNSLSDGVTWHGGEYQRFPIKEVMDRLYGSITPSIPKGVAVFIWSIKVPPRVHITLWLAALERLKTGDALLERGIISPAQAMCPLCESALETNSHILFTCSFSWSLWMQVLKWWGISGVLPERSVHFFSRWKYLAPYRSKGKIWNLVLGCVIWSLWFERNKVKFNNGRPDADHLFYALKIRISIWVREILGLDLLSGLNGSSVDYQLL